MASPVKALIDATGAVSMAPARRNMVVRTATPRMMPSVWQMQRRSPMEEFLPYNHLYEVGVVKSPTPNRAPLVGVIFKRRDAAVAAVKTFPPIYKEYGAKNPRPQTGQIWPRKTTPN